MAVLSGFGGKYSGACGRRFLLLHLDGEQSEAVWRLFGTVYGFGAYGEQIWMEMDPGQVTAEDSELSFILHNDTGRSIQYILSPPLRKRQRRMERRAGNRWKAWRVSAAI